MDFFNVMYWANDIGRYTVWNSVYPPINFLFLQSISWSFLGGLTDFSGVELRAAGIGMPLFIFFSYLLLPVLVLKNDIWSSFRFKEKVVFYIIGITATPMLFALERGNLILFSIPFLASALSNTRWVRILSVGMLINIKPYFALLLVGYVAKKQWSEFFWASFSAGAIFLVTGLILDQNFWMFFPNLLGFSQNDALFSLREVLAFPSSVSAFSYVLKSEGYRLYDIFAGQDGIAVIANFIEITKWIVLAFAFLTVLFRGGRSSFKELTAVMLVLISNLGIGVGGYSMIFLFPLLPIFFGMKYAKFYIVVIFILFSSIDVIPLIETPLKIQYSYLGDEDVIVNWTLSISSFVRPLLNLLLLFVLSSEVFFKAKQASNHFILLPIQQYGDGK